MPGSFIPEKNFDRVFNTGDFGTFFYNQIEQFNWKYLLYNDPNHYYVPDLVDEFYKSFTRNDISDSRETIYIFMRGQFFELNIQTISEITGIEIMDEHQEHGHIEDYLPVMGIDCQIAPDGGIKNTTLFRNILTTARWINSNVLGTSHNSSFYLQALHIIHCLMINERRFCMCRQLMTTISDMHMKPRQTYPVPILVTLICHYFMGDEAFQEHINTHQVKNIFTERISISYRDCLTICWLPSYEEEDIPVADLSFTEEEPPPLSFYQRPHPTNSRESTDKIFEGMRGIVLRQIRIDRKLDQILDDKEGGVGPSKKRKR